MRLGRCGTAVTAALAFAALALLAVSLAAPSASADTVVNPFAGDWSTFSGSGTLRLQVVNATKGQQAVAFYSGGSGSCASQTVYYTGAYSVSSDSGQIAGCTDTSGRHLTGWYQSGAGPQHGTVSIAVGAANTWFSGDYSELSDGTSGHYDGTFTGDFPDSGRLPPGCSPASAHAGSRAASVRGRAAAVVRVASITSVDPENVDVEIIHEDGVICEAKPGDQLKQSDRIKTGFANSATLDFGGKATVVIEQVTEVRIDTFNLGEIADVELWLKGGGIAAQVTKNAAAPNSFRVKSPTLAASIRGSAMTVRYQPTTHLSTVAVTQDQAIVQPLAFRSPPSAPGFGSWRPGPPTAAPMIVLQGESVRVGTGGVIVSDLSKAIPAARLLHVGALSATVPGTISLSTLIRSRCVRIEAAATKKATGRLRILAASQVFAARSLRFKRQGSQVLCIAKTAVARRLSHGTALAALNVTLSSPGHKTADGHITLTH